MFSHHPEILGEFLIDCPEMLMVQYMPIAMPGTSVRIPPHLECFRPLVDAVLAKLTTDNDYIYLTAKSMYVSEGCNPNRSGWHIDGFGTYDKNYIWADSMPTEFCVGQRFELSDDHNLSLLEMEQQVCPENIVTYPINSLIELDSTIVHRVAPIPVAGMRTFCKISVSEHQYNLKGNAHNYMFDYKWEMIDRTIERNHPIAKSN